MADTKQASRSRNNGSSGSSEFGEELQHLVSALADRVLSGANDKVGGLTERLSGLGDGSGKAVAKAGEKVFWLGYTGVRTSGYASTTQVANWMNELTGGQGGGFRLLALHHHYPTDAEEHRAALVESGPGLLAGALEAWVKGR